MTETPWNHARHVARIVGLLFGHVLFWGWNLLFLSLLGFGYAPLLLGQMVVASWVGMVPWSITLPATLLVALPLPFLVLGAWKLHSDPGRLLTMFYGVQVPLMLLCLVRIFAIGPLSLPTGLAIVWLTVSSLGLLRTVLHGFEERTAPAQVARQIAGAASLLVGLWSGVVLGIHAVAFVVTLVGDVWEMLWSTSLWHLIEGSVYMGFGLLSLALLALYPVAMVGSSLRAWQVVHRATAARFGVPRALGITAATLLAGVLSFALAARQPQGAAFALADAALADDATDADRRAVIDQADRVRAGLVAARTGPDRLFEADPEGEHIAQMYRGILPFGLEAVPQATWSTLMSPFVYQRVHDGHGRRAARRRARPTDDHEARRAYAALFDVPMDRAERDVLLASAHATWNWQEAQASLLDIGEQRVHLDRQTIDVVPSGDVATVTVHDVYRSRTWQREEVFVSFALPESAAVTGLWLGATDDRDAAFRHVLAPRGAAQEVYETEVERRVDPALLEQVGPRQYRLRAFPVLPREGQPNDVWSLTAEGPELHVWIEVVVPKTGDVYPLPVATEVRNLFWDDATERAANDDAWLPPSVRADGAPLAPHRVVVGDWAVTATPSAPRPRDRGRTAVLVDGTASMAAHRIAVATALAELQAMGPVEVWCTREAAVVRCPDFDAAQALFFGAVGLDQQLAAWAPDADRRVVLTDAGSYELGRRDTVVLPDDTPLWLVHLGGAFPQAYGDTVLDELTSTGGGAVATVAELERRTDPDWLDGWTWSFEPVEEAVPATDDPFAPLAARALIRHLDRTAEVRDLAFFDHVHAVARGADVVTSYSSMLALVNDRQLQALKDAEGRADRFDREVIDQQETISAIPEPSTWLLLALGALGLGAGRRRISGRTAS